MGKTIFSTPVFSPKIHIPRKNPANFCGSEGYIYYVTPPTESIINIIENTKKSEPRKLAQE